MIEWVWPLVIVLLPLPFFVRKFIPKVVKSIEQPLLISTVPFLNNQADTTGQSRYKLLLISLIWCLLIVAAMRPQWLGEPLNLQRQGRDLMLAIDLSGSMATADMQTRLKVVDRLSAVKDVVAQFIKRRKGDRLGLILFADHAYLQTPLTFDLVTIQQMLNEAELGLVGKQTAIGEAIGLAVKRFVAAKQQQRILILLTDGQNNAGQIVPLQAAKLAKEQDVVIYTIGVGANELLRRSIFGTQRINPAKDLDKAEATLAQLAQITGGQYFRARNPQELEQIYQKLDKLNPIDQDKQQLRPKKPLFIYPLLLALMLSLFLYHIPLRRSSNG